MILRACGLSYAYPGGVTALDGLDLDVPTGRRLAILGPNGSGKTTLLLHLNGTLRPASGRVLIDGEPGGYNRAALAAWRRRVGLVLQDPDDQLFAASLREDVTFGPLNMGLSDDEALARADEALAALRIGDLAERATHMLSFGQKKRAAIAGLLAMRPDVLMLDEPTAGMDEFSVSHLLAALDKVVAAGASLAFSTHDVDLAYGWADEVALFCHGKVLRQGPPAEVLADRELLKAARLRLPWALEIGLKARSRGLIGADGPLPRSRGDVMALLDAITLAPNR